ncbi:hypothetical protein SAMN05445850_3037 [Paraburkholderia tuberum]|uniref:Uncharacterized protein n=1 Tax=Paraburkholderia tuberum TaxID=157910 RepID=A0A1H1GRG4_9BURK|nr:hypothetical protein SAMN05445850_3037 [Paraburkholderia tuberum]
MTKRKTSLWRATAATIFCVAASYAQADRYPVTVRSCNRDVTFARAPARAVSNDSNLTEMMLALGLRTEWHLLKPVERAHIFGRAHVRCDEALSAMGRTSVFVCAFVVRCDRGDSQRKTA